MTFIFTAFVLLQIFNMICARKIHDEFNIFEGMFTNVMFCVLFVVILIGQVIITQFGGRMFVVCLDGLTWQQWLLAFAVGSTTWIVNVILKCVPDWVTPSMGNDSVFNAKYPERAPKVSQ